MSTRNDNAYSKHIKRIRNANTKKNKPDVVQKTDDDEGRSLSVARVHSPPPRKPNADPSPQLDQKRSRRKRVYNYIDKFFDELANKEKDDDLRRMADFDEFKMHLEELANEKRVRDLQRAAAAVSPFENDSEEEDSKEEAAGAGHAYAAAAADGGYSGQEKEGGGGRGQEGKDAGIKGKHKLAKRKKKQSKKKAAKKKQSKRNKAKRNKAKKKQSKKK